MAALRRTSPPGTSGDRPARGAVRLGRGGAGSASSKGAAAGRGAGKGPAKKGPAGRGGRPKASRRERFSQIQQAFTLTRKGDPKMVPLVLAGLLVPFVLLLVVGLLVGHPVLLGLLGLVVGLLVAVAVFGRRVQGTAFSQVEGQLGAAAAVLQNMRGDWRVTPAVGYTREQDLVHRVLGRPGVVLVAEGSPSRTRSLVVAEKKRLARVAGDTPVYDVSVGDGEGQVPLRGLEKHFVKLPRNIKPKQVNVLDGRLKALGTAPPPIPKGPVPRNGRVPRGKVR
jgi:hypothetical protein